MEELKRQLQPKRERTDDDAGDAHEMISEVDNWDLRDHRQQATRVMHGKECTWTGKITSVVVVAQHLRGVQGAALWER